MGEINIIKQCILPRSTTFRSPLTEVKIKYTGTDEECDWLIKNILEVNSRLSGKKNKREKDLKHG